jgi:eukaryotic-like serine/threonine-protein kinase
MTPERWRQVEQLFQEALTREPEGRGAFLAQIAGGDEEIRHAVERLLAQSSPHTSPIPYLQEAAPTTTLPDGFRLGPYEIAGVLGSGGMGKVYRGLDTRLGRPVAIKISAELPGANFKREARAISALNHPHICTLYDVGPNYLVMELVEGESLAQRLDRGALPVNEVLRFGAEMAEALGAAHARGIVHRDLKPGNIMLTTIGIKVLDFGLAKVTVQAAEAVSYSTTTQSVIQPGMIQGTLAYMAPEQLEGAECDGRTDIYSFGLILYEMATGRRAFAAASQATLIGDILHRVPDLSVLHPAGLKAIVEKCLQKKPADRWQSGDEVRQALQLVEKVPTASLAEMRGGVTRSSRRFLTKALSVAAIVILLGGTGVALWLRTWRPHASRSVSVAPLGDYAGMVQQPSLSPDGSHVAFSWNGADQQNFDVYVKPIGAGVALKGMPLRLTTDPADDFAPAWSPDGSSIAFLRQVNEGNHYLVLLVPALGGLERRLTEVTLADTSQLTGPYLAWLPDSQSLVITDTARAGEGNALFLLSISTGKRQQITFPPAGDIGDHCVSASLHGESLLFRRATLQPEWSGKAYVLTVGRDMPSAGHDDTVEAPANQCAVWTSDGQRIVYAQGLGMWELPVGKSGEAPKLLVETGRGSNWPSVAANGSRMAYARKIGGDLELWRVAVTEDGRVSGAAAKFASAWRDEFTPAYSPDGAKVAFTAGRAEVSEIWVCNRDGSGCSQLTWTDSANTGDPSWSPDGRSIAYYSTAGGRARIYTIAAQGGDAHAVTSADADSIHPSWSHDGKWIYFTSRQTGAYQVWKIAQEGGRPVQVTQNGGYAPVESPDGRWLYYVSDADKEAGLWRVRVSGEKPEQVLPSVLFHNFAVAARGIYFIARSDQGPAIQFLNFASGQTRVVAPVRSGYTGLAVSPDARTILYTETSPATSQIYVIDNFQ